MLLYSETELQEFIKLLPQLEKDELWFVSLSARNKYLNEEEREFYHLGRTEMFSREFIYETYLENFKYVLTMLEAQLTYRRTKSNQLFPEKAMITYFNLNPSSGISAYLDFQKEMNKELGDLVNGLEKNNDNERIYSRFKKCQSILKSSFQTEISRKIFLDVDFDTLDYAYVNDFTSFCDDNNIKYFVVSTKSGFHVCLKKETVKCNFMKILSALDTSVKSKGKGEVILNSNLMIPLPGTLQGGHEVLILCSTL